MSSIYGDTDVSPQAIPDSSLDVKVRMDVLVHALRLGGRKGDPTSISVPPGHVVVLSHGGELADPGGKPNVYLAGEVATRSRYHKSVPCWALQLREFPGRVDIHARRVLAAISPSDEDQASLSLSFYVRLRDPMLLLRRAGGKWETEKDRDDFNRRLESEVKEWLEALLEQDLRIWSGDTSSVLTSVFQAADDYLRRIGLRVDTTDGGESTSALIFTRRFPSRLYDLAFQFAQGERALRLGGPSICEKSGIPESEAQAITASSDRAGVALFRWLMGARPEARKQLADWLSQLGMQDAASFIRNLYLGKVKEREVALSEQVLLSAIRNPWLTQGEWLRQASESPLTRFQQIEDKIRGLLKGS